MLVCVNQRDEHLRRAVRAAGVRLVLLLVCAGCASDVRWLDMSGSVLTLGGQQPCYIFLRGETTLKAARTCLETSAPTGRRHERIAIAQPDSETTVETWQVWPDDSHHLIVRLTFVAGATDAPRIRIIEFGKFEHVAPNR